MIVFLLVIKILMFLKMLKIKVVAPSIILFHRLACKMLILQKSKITRQRAFTFSWNFHMIFEEQIRISYTKLKRQRAVGFFFFCFCLFVCFFFPQMSSVTRVHFLNLSFADTYQYWSCFSPYPLCKSLIRPHDTVALTNRYRTHPWCHCVHADIKLYFKAS